MMPSSTSSSEGHGWRRFGLAFLGTAAGSALAVYLFIVMVDPFGMLPVSLPFDRGPVDSNARYAFPMLAQNPRFDSAILGTSTSRLLRPIELDRELGTKFVNLSMNSATANEQSRLFRVFLRAHPNPHAILFGLDIQWCVDAGRYEMFTDRPFPAWMYDGSPWRGYLEMADLYSIEKAGQAFAEWTGMKRRVYGRDGYTSFVPDENRYDIAKVAEKMRGVGPYVPDGPSLGTEEWREPALDLLRKDIADLPAQTLKLLVFMPVNQRLIAEQPGTAREFRRLCKRRVAEIAGNAANAVAIDFMIPSPITSDDDNYWDPLHYRVGIANRIGIDIALALKGVTNADFGMLNRESPDQE